jgi:hypothetical protein
MIGDVVAKLAADAREAAAVAAVDQAAAKHGEAIAMMVMGAVLARAIGRARRERERVEEWA